MKINEFQLFSLFFIITELMILILLLTNSFNWPYDLLPFLLTVIIIGILILIWQLLQIKKTFERARVMRFEGG